MIYLIVISIAVVLAFLYRYLTPTKTSTINSVKPPVTLDPWKSDTQSTEANSQRRKIVLGLDIGGVVDAPAIVTNSKEEIRCAHTSNLCGGDMVMHPKMVKSATMLAAIKEHSDMTLVFQSSNAPEDQQRDWNRYMQHVLAYNQRHRNASIPELPRVSLITVPAPYRIEGASITKEQMEDLVQGNNAHGCPTTITLNHVNGTRQEQYEVPIQYYSSEGTKADAHQIVMGRFKVPLTDFYYLDDGRSNITRASGMGIQAIHIDTECMADALERINRSLSIGSGFESNLAAAAGSLFSNR